MSSFGKWGQAGVPHKGWRRVGVEDIGSLEHTCEMCEHELVRHVHHMEHDDHEALKVGCICAGNMQSDIEAAKEATARSKNRARRRSTWLTRQWRVSHKGNEYLRVDGMTVTIFRRGNGWKASIHVPAKYDVITQETTAEQTVFSRKIYASADEAKLAVFDVLNPRTTP